MESEKPPFFSNWNKVYIFIIAVLVIVIFSLYLFTKAFE
jgi:hypothetical protein